MNGEPKINDGISVDLRYMKFSTFMPITLQLREQALSN